MKMALKEYGQNQGQEREYSTDPKEMWAEACSYAKKDAKTIRGVLDKLGIECSDQDLAQITAEVKYEMIANARLNRDTTFENLKMPSTLPNV
jgi:HD-like signal output (HDOD) protein